MEIILGLIIFTLIGYIVWKDQHFSKERRELLNAVLSKDSIEFATANKIGEVVEDKKEKLPPEYISQDSLSDDEFVESITKTFEDTN